MSAVNEGLTPTKSWKLEKQKAEWMIGDTLNAGIGQGYVLASPLQLAVMTARIATGRNILPRLVKAIDDAEQPILGGESLGLDPLHLAMVREGMSAVVNDQHGTAYGSRIVEETVRMAGKTGTSQVRNITAAERARGVTSNDDLPWERRDHALFVAYAPTDRPKYAVALIVEHGGGGSAAAAPIARDIMLQALYEDFPPLDVYPQSQRQRIENERKELQFTTPVQPAATPVRT
jgi:penicillin-binding protein 2